jgi:hypothetical protein
MCVIGDEGNAWRTCGVAGKRWCEAMDWSGIRSWSLTWLCIAWAECESVPRGCGGLIEKGGTRCRLSSTPNEDYVHVGFVVLFKVHRSGKVARLHG